MDDEPRYELLDQDDTWTAVRYESDEDHDGTVFATWDREADPEKPRGGILAQMTDVAQARLGRPVTWDRTDTGYRFV